MQNATTTEANSATSVASVTDNVANCKLSTTTNIPSDKPASTGDAASPAPAPDTPTAAAASGGSFAGTFKAFSKFGDTKSDGKHITLSQSDKWMKQAKVIDGKRITTTDTGIYFKKQKSMKLSMEQYKAFLDELAKAKKVELTEIKSKLSNSGAPGLSLGPAGAAGKSPSAVERLTDVSKYTGSHKQRFDETGKGKGIAGRKDLPDASGYVQGYQNKDTYKAH